MDEVGEIVINDLLSFLFCKKNDYPADMLLSSARKFYGDKVITEARTTLFKALPEKPSTKQARLVDENDDLKAIYRCLQLIPEDEMPYFVCINLNNVPMLKGSSSDQSEELSSVISQPDLLKASPEPQRNSESSQLQTIEASPSKNEPEISDEWEARSSDSESYSESDAGSLSSGDLGYDCYEIEYGGEEEEVIDLESNHADLLYRQCLSENGPQMSKETISGEHHDTAQTEIGDNAEPLYDPNLQIKEEIDIDFESEDVLLPAVSLANQGTGTSNTFNDDKKDADDSCMALRIESVMAGPNTVALSQQLNSHETSKDNIPAPTPLRNKELSNHEKSSKLHRKSHRSKSKKLHRVLMEQLSDGPLKKEQLSILRAIYCPLCGFKTNFKNILLRHMKLHT